VAGSNYEVNIKLNVQKINQQINNLERRISKLNALAQGKKGDSKTLLKNERDKAALLLKQERAQKNINKELAKTNKLKKESLALSKKESTKGLRPTSKIPLGPSSPLKFSPMGQMLPGKGVAPGGGGGGALASALISGAFPLLFGQGLLGGAVGAAGGAIGGKFGGQMGGFAGGLVATAVLSQIQTLVTNINTLGNAFDILNPNIEQLIVSSGIAGTVEAERLRVLEKSEGRHAALAAATEKMNQAIGEKGVKNVQEFAKASRMLGNSFKVAMAKMQAALAPFFKFFATAINGITGESQRSRAELLTLAESQGGEQVDKLNALRERLAGIDSSKQNEHKRRRLKKQISDIEKQLVKEGKSLELAQLRTDQFNLATKAIRAQNKNMQNQIQLGSFAAEVEQEKLRIAKEMDIPLKDITKEMEEQIADSLELRNSLQRTLDLYGSIATSIETGLVDAIEGAIQGTRTLGDVARSVFAQIQRSLIEYGVNSFLTTLPGGIGKFFGGRADGGPVKAGGSYMVGERGPELFTPKSSGMITPNHALGSSTNVVVNVDASGSSIQGDEDRGKELGRLISVAVQSEILQQQRPGGLLA
jgi:hypothetical protein